MQFTESVRRGLLAPLVLMGRSTWLFLGLIGLLIGAAWLPSIPFTGAIFVLVPGLFVGYAVAYYRWSLSETWERLRLHGLFMVKLMAIYAVPTLLFMVAFRWIDVHAYQSLMYLNAGDAVHNAWLRFFDKLPMELALVVLFFYLFWPAIQLLIHKSERVSSYEMMEASADLFELVSFRWLMVMTVLTLGLDVLWSWYGAEIVQSWVSFAMAFGLVFVTVWFSGWSFLYGLSLEAVKKQG